MSLVVLTSAAKMTQSDLAIMLLLMMVMSNTLLRQNIQLMEEVLRGTYKSTFF
jgi:hypothetical protein